MDIDVGSRRQTLSCSFCGKWEREVRRMVKATRHRTSTASVPVICDECVILCAEIMREAGERRG
jgi:ATP-dependent protease Clp ATPase subunit